MLTRGIVLVLAKIAASSRAAPSGHDNHGAIWHNAVDQSQVSYSSYPGDIVTQDGDSLQYHQNDDFDHPFDQYSSLDGTYASELTPFSLLKSQQGMKHEPLFTTSDILPWHDEEQGIYNLSLGQDGSTLPCYAMLEEIPSKFTDIISTPYKGCTSSSNLEGVDNAELPYQPQE